MSNKSFLVGLPFIFLSVAILRGTDSILSPLIFNQPSPFDVETIIVSPKDEPAQKLSKSRDRDIDRQDICLDEFSDCGEFVAICRHAVFSGIMRKNCRRTCQLCSNRRKNAPKSSLSLLATKPSSAPVFLVARRLDKEDVKHDRHFKWHSPTANSSRSRYPDKVPITSNLVEDCEERLPGGCVARRIACETLVHPSKPLTMRDICAGSCSICRIPNDKSRIMPTNDQRLTATALNNSRPVDAEKSASEDVDQALIDFLRENFTARRLVEEILPRILSSMSRPSIKDGDERDIQSSMKQKIIRPNDVECTDRVPNCVERVDLCAHGIYWRLMKRVCARSCGFCIGQPSGYDSEFKKIKR